MALETLPIREKEKFLAEEEKARRLELRAIKENIWKKWRNRREGTVHKSGEEKEFEKSEMEKKLEKLERIIERIKSEEIERGERQERDRERKRVWRKEKEKEENKMLVREVERVERREKKKELEDRWSLMKWLAKFIEENEGNWKREELIKGKKLSVEEWETLTEKGKKEDIVRFETQKEKSLRKSNSWRAVAIGFDLLQFLLIAKWVAAQVFSYRRWVGSTRTQKWWYHFSLVLNASHF